MTLDPRIFSLKSNTPGRKATLRWMPLRKSMVVQIVEQSYEGMDPLRWTAEIGLGELINELQLTKEDVTAAIEIDIALGNKEVNYDHGWFKRERVSTYVKKGSRWRNHVKGSVDDAQETADDGEGIK